MPRATQATTKLDRQILDLREQQNEDLNKWLKYQGKNWIASIDAHL